MGFWFGRKSVPERQKLVPAWLTGEAGEGGFARGYQAQLDEVYRRNPVGLRAVRLVAGLVGSLPLFAEEGDAKAVGLVRAHGLMERAAAALLLHGNAYVRLAVDGHDRPAELLLMRPERVSVACGADGWPSAYLYRAGGQVVRIAKDDALGRRQVAHLKALDPADDHYGLGCLEAAVGIWPERRSAWSIDPRCGRSSCSQARLARRFSQLRTGLEMSHRFRQPSDWSAGRRCVRRHPATSGCGAKARPFGPSGSGGAIAAGPGSTALAIPTTDSRSFIGLALAGPAVRRSLRPRAGP